MYHVLYNPLSANGKGQNKAQRLKELLKDGEAVFSDIREVGDWSKFLSELGESDSLVLAGGDGTLNRFINLTDGLKLPEKLFYYAVGSGNDFYHEVATEADQLIPLNEYIKRLPTVTVKGTTHKFLNGIGYGIHGYCCEVGDEIKRTSDKPVNYTSIAIKGLLFHYKPTRAVVKVDGVERTFEKVWLAPSMNGKCYGGGMMIAPAQDRLSEEAALTLVVLHGTSKLKTLMVFPSIFKGEHVKHTGAFEFLTGKELEVSFDRPVALQIDGETVLDVTEYKVTAANVTVPVEKSAETAGV